MNDKHVSAHHDVQLSTCTCCKHQRNHHLQLPSLILPDGLLSTLFSGYLQQIASSLHDAPKLSAFLHNPGADHPSGVIGTSSGRHLSGIAHHHPHAPDCPMAPAVQGFIGQGPQGAAEKNRGVPHPDGTGCDHCRADWNSILAGGYTLALISSKGSAHPHCQLHTDVTMLSDCQPSWLPSVFLLVGVLYVIAAQSLASMCCAVAILEPS